VRWPAGAAGDAPRPRDRRGRRHTLASVLAVSAAAVAAGARSVTAIAEWATDAPGPVLAALGVRCDPLTRRCQVPGRGTIRRVRARVDGDAVDATIGAWLADRLRPLQHRRVLAVDGKTLRGSAHGGHQVHLLAALDLASVVVTAHALHTQRDHASFLVDRGRRGPAGRQGQPARSARPAGRATVAADPGDGPHPRAWPRPHRAADPEGRCCRRPVLSHAAQAIQVTRRVRAPGSRRWRIVTVYAITSLALGSASPAQLAGWLRGH
jgi:hypothetical protein